MILTTLALIGAEPPPPPPASISAPAVDVWAWNPADAIRDGSASCGDCQSRTELFWAGLEMHGGYYLRTASNPDEWVFIVFAAPEVADQFNAFFSRENMRTLLNKRPYCECTGRRYVMWSGSTVIFQVERARLFARRG